VWGCGSRIRIRSGGRLVCEVLTFARAGAVTWVLALVVIGITSALAPLTALNIRTQTVSMSHGVCSFANVERLRVVVKVPKLSLA
jgi:hypothetical protein